MLVVAAVGVAALVAAGAPGASVSGPCRAAAAPPRWTHVVWIWMENKSYDSIVGSTSAPYLTHLASVCGLATNYVGVAHPSLPNYLAATSGGTWGVTDDAPPSAHPIGHASIFSQLSSAGLTWRSYEEAMPATCGLSSSGEYAVKHNPAAYYTGLRADCSKWDVPFSALSTDLRSDRLPSFSFVTPNLCDDMHDCSVATGDAWLHRWVATILASPDYRSGSTTVVITLDEGTDSANHVATVIVSPAIRPGTRSAERFDHYSLLRTTEQLLGMTTYLAHARSAASMRTAFRL
jgi:phospholipase C